MFPSPLEMSGNKQGPFSHLQLECHTRSEAGKGKASASVRRNKLQPIEAVTVRYPSTGSRQDLAEIHFIQLPCEKPRRQRVQFFRASTISFRPVLATSRTSACGSSLIHEKPFVALAQSYCTSLVPCLLRLLLCQPPSLRTPHW